MADWYKEQSKQADKTNKAKDKQMANRNNVQTATANKQSNDADEQDDDIPDVFRDDLPTKSGDVIPSSQTGTRSLDDLANTANAVSSKRDEEEWQKLNPPVGDWEKEDTWKLVSVTVKAGDCQPDDRDPEGRTIITLMGKPKIKVMNGYEYQPTLFLRVSPDKRTKQDDPSKNDLAYSLWLQAKHSLYVSLYKERAVSDKQVALMLLNDGYAFRTMNGDNGPMITQLKLKGMQRQGIRPER